LRLVAERRPHTSQLEPSESHDDTISLPYRFCNSAWAPSRQVHVVAVLQRCSRIEMALVDASPIVALMQHM
ncbi:MAG: hypothetical protein MJA83_17845, partial [Gammaproteobacteria bacterium]|nr:hypothetical protein [Gammaproteobacteria bacterium]